MTNLPFIEAIFLSISPSLPDKGRNLERQLSTTPPGVLLPHVPSAADHELPPDFPICLSVLLSLHQCPSPSPTLEGLMPCG